MNSIDKSTKLLLAVIALALWLIALNPWLKPFPVIAAQDMYGVELWLTMINGSVSSIKSDVSRIERNTR